MITNCYSKDYTTRNAQVVAARRAGFTLEEIGEQHGISRQRVHIILNLTVGTTNLGPLRLIGIDRMAKYLKATETQIKRFLQLYKVEPIIRKGHRAYPIGLLGQIRVWLGKQNKFCLHCRRPIKFEARACGECWQKHRWELMTPEQKQKHIKVNEEWRADHLDQYHQISLRAGRKYCANKKLEKGV